MKIAFLSYGKMGQTIEKIAWERRHDIVIKTNEEERYDITQADVAIDISVPAAACINIPSCLKRGIPVIPWTTGWLDNYENAIKLCEENKGAFLYASNFSLGVNIFFELNKSLAKMMSQLKQYQVSIEEIHHTEKLDAPSGTAITLAEGIISQHTEYNTWLLNQNEEQTIPITAKRIENVPGTHNITYKSHTDSINITHTAHTREGFALGA